MTKRLLEVADLTKGFVTRGADGRIAQLKALRGVSFTLDRGETLGIVGESGSGKSTLARSVVRLIEPDGGSIRFDGTDARRLSGRERSQFNRRVQMVFQDPYSSLNPRMTVRAALAEAIGVHRLRPPAAVDGRIAELLDLVQLPQEAAERYPRDFSGGQRQRIGIARALAVEPDCLIADEIVSALDLSIQAQIINLLLELQARLDLAILFISHDLRIVRHISHRVGVMYLGEIVETGGAEQVFADPRHPYTQALIAAAPTLDPGRRGRQEAVHGELPSPIDLPAGCSFASRCVHVMERCLTMPPALLSVDRTRAARCYLTENAAPPALREKSP
ncbi:MAG: peptide transporter ATP-binding protein [Rhodospirillales bacterium]|nr:peptide transporter ATP-binding protein [Rhodospirillales bacterium]